MEKLSHTTESIIDENVEKLAELFPEVVTEVREPDGSLRHTIDVDALKQRVGDVAEGQRERYQFTWPGKRGAKQEAYRQIDKCLRPCPEESVDWDTTQNLYIEGDNLDALKLLRNTYAGKVKMIYIDPPYNTGQDFVYHDNFAHSYMDDMAVSGAFDESGNLLDAVYKMNNESAGRFHSDWCSMMYPRLLLARDLLSADGCIFISIDQNEEANLTKLCDDVFGHNGYVNHFAWINNLTGRQLSGTGAARTWESILAYARNPALLGSFSVGIDCAKKLMPDSYKGFNRDVHRDSIGEFVIGDTLWNHNRMFNEETRPNLVFSIFYNKATGEFVPGEIGETKEGYVEIPPHNNGDGVHKYHAWRWSKNKIAQEGHNLIVRTLRNGQYEIYTRIRDFGSTVMKDVITNIGNGSDELTSLFDGKKIFSYPKSIDLLKTVCSSLSQNDIVLDFFSGSATTAHAVMQLNAEDGGSRKFIMVQLPEVCDERSEAAKAGYENICEIGKERIRRAGRKIAEEVEESNRQLKLGEEPKRVPDVGFRVLKIDSSNFEDVSAEPGELSQGSMLRYADNLKLDRTPDDLIIQVMLKKQIELSASIEKLDVDGCTVFSVDGGRLIACFDRDVSVEVMTAMAKMEPDYAVMRDASFAGDDAVSNFAEIFKNYSSITEVEVI